MQNKKRKVLYTDAIRVAWHLYAKDVIYFGHCKIFKILIELWFTLLLLVYAFVNLFSVLNGSYIALYIA